MKPSRKLDALVAEKVMGWTDVKAVSETANGSPPAHPNSLAVIPFYSSRIADAWAVMEWIWSQNDDFVIWPDGDPDGIGEGYAVHATCDSEFEPETRAWAPTAPEAICLAALKLANHLAEHKSS